jgi:thioesterase domain-containing protein
VATAVNGLPHDAGLEQVRRYVAVYQLNHRAAGRYRPRAVYPGAVALFRAAERSAEEGPDPALGWGAWVGGPLQIHVVPGTHNTFIEEPNVPVLAERLRFCLDQALGNGPERPIG